MNIGKRDIFWNYGATFLKIASSALLLPLALRTMSSEMVGIWSIFTAVTSFSSLLDFGFGPSFTRNITYVFSGVRSLRAEGFESVSTDSSSVDYGLLKGIIEAMRWFYLRIAVVLLTLIGTLGTYYVVTLLTNYSGNHMEVYIAWILLCVVNTYNLYTLYYETLLQGKGLVKTSKQIAVAGHLIFLFTAASLLLLGYGLIAIVVAQASGFLLVRGLSYRVFFTHELKLQLRQATPHHGKDVLKLIYPNAVKIGLTSLGAFLILRSSIIIGSLYLPLDQIASYGISTQLILVLSGMGGTYIATYLPKIAKLRVEGNSSEIADLYLKGQVVLAATYFIGGVILITLGEWAISLIGSETHLLAPPVLAVALLISLLETGHSVAASILLSKNEVPFFKPSLLSGAATILLLLLLLQTSTLGVWAMVLAPGIVQACYQNWKWPLEVHLELGISSRKILSGSWLRG